MNKKSSYLSERIYERNKHEKEDRNVAKYSYWRTIIGEKNFKYLLNNNQKFIQFLNGNEYMVEGNTILDSLLRYLIQGKVDIKELICFENRIFFPEFYYKILQYCVISLKKRLQKFQSCYSETIYKDFSVHLCRELENMCLRTLIFEMHFYKQAEKLKGETNSQQYDFFCEKCIGKSWFYKELFEKYPVLYRCVLNRCDQMEDYYVEVVENFYEDHDEIQQYMLGSESVNQITGIEGGFSDSHNEGKQTLRIKIDNAIEILYKPHSMDNEKMFYDLLSWFSVKTGITQFSYPFISKNTHSWSVCVEYSTCETEQQLKKYYRRLGVQLFLAYFLGTKDLHCENIISSGEYPVLIDLEVLVSISAAQDRRAVTEEINYQLSKSVLYTGLLPFYYWNRYGKGINCSAINGSGEQQYPFKVPVIMNERTSDMKIEYRYPMSKKENNMATWNGKFYEPYLYIDELMKGFTQAYNQAIKNKDELHVLLKQLSGLNSRVLVADTQRYSMMLSSSYHPSLLKDGADREVFLYAMMTGRKEQDIAIVNSEVKSMLNGDIPYFYCTLSEKNLLSGKKTIYLNYFPEDGEKEVYRKLDALNESDFEKQKEYIQLSLELLSDNESGLKNNVYSASSNITIKSEGKDNRTYTLNDLIERLMNYVVWNQEKTEVSWSTTQFVSLEQTAWKMKPMNHYLYDGLAGMLLLFFELSHERKNVKIHKIYRTLKEMLFRYTDEGTTSLVNLDTKNTGAYEGESSIAYVYILLYQQSKDEEYLKYAKRHMCIVKKVMNEDIHCDLLSGNAGAAWISILLYQISKEQDYICIAEQAVKRLKEMSEKYLNGLGWVIEKGVPPMAGMAHGNSGVLMPVIALWKYTGKNEYKKLAEQIWNYENSLYNSIIGNWEDTRVEKISNMKDSIGAVAWCHGAAGILLSRIICYELLDDKMWKKRIEKDIRKAYVKLKGYWRRDSYCLCHGMCGNLWILSIAEQKIKKHGISINLDLAQEKVEMKKISLLTQEKMTPGFMNGYGGIIYALLELE